MDNTAASMINTPMTSQLQLLTAVNTHIPACRNLSSLSFHFPSASVII